MKIKDKIVSFIKNFSVKYYLEEFKKVEQKQFSWNLSAFLFGSAWLAYRKMPEYCLVSALVMIVIILGIYDPLILSVDCKDFMSSPRLYIFLMVMLLYMMLHGILGNSLYLKYLKKKKRSSQPVAPIFGSLCLFYYINCFQGVLWLRHYRMTHCYCSSILTEIWAIFGEISSWIFAIFITIIFYKAYEFVIAHRDRPIEFNTENAAEILSVKLSIVWWSIPAIPILGVCYLSISEYTIYLRTFLQKI